MNQTVNYSKQNYLRVLKIFLLFVSALTISFAMLGCGESSTDTGIENGHGNGDGNGNGTEEPGPGEVWMVNQSFNPANLEVDVGTTVTWENRSNEIHTVTSGSGRTHDGLFDSGNIPPDGEYSYTFNEVGEFDYFCIPHQGMNATVTVVDSE
jgi:plastocyanin